ncbi:MAG: inner membrane protein [Salinirussus sp.]|jgi:inner membrane protein
MYRNGHYGAALLAYAPVGFLVAALGYRTLALLAAGVALAVAMVPDLDIRVPGLKHRGPTHTVGFALLVGAVVGALGVTVVTAGNPAAVSTALATRDGGITALGVGVLGGLVSALTVCSHIAVDALTPMGVTPFWPLSDRHVSLDVVRASNRVANAVLLGVGVAAAAGSYWLALQVAG